MKRIAAAALSLALIAGGSIGAMAATAGANPAAEGTQTATPAPWRPHQKTDPLGDRYTDALNLLAADGYTDISDVAGNGQTFTVMATDPHLNRVSVVVDPSAGTVQPAK